MNRLKWYLTLKNMAILLTAVFSHAYTIILFFHECHYHLGSVENKINTEFF